MNKTRKSGNGVEANLSSGRLGSRTGAHRSAVRFSSTRVAIASLALVLAACETVTASTAISSPLEASEFNDVASRYLDRPTEVKLVAIKETGAVLQVRMHQYDEGLASASTGITGPHTIGFEGRRVDDYLAMLDKYAEWDKLARERGDIVDRVIGTVKGGGAGGAGQDKFTFVSGNAESHLLRVEFCLTACVNPIYFTRENVVILRGLLVDLKEGRLTQLDVDSVYK